MAKIPKMKISNNPAKRYTPSPVKSDCVVMANTFRPNTRKPVAITAQSTEFTVYTEQITPTRKPSV
eukprot:CAMPEP_0172883218 /NCGR_PEP_ID=MMETSP1075-20121228/122128_1 /TAXON_ID=2916 /ORGANISM="Ceratium fusus, Strain PA161109" /LENGTH=65 /DNA_ID=CAMNT_0013736059 /DNA_START=125 /DNA_END=318 /DNA_ORIENTATION=+